MKFFSVLLLRKRAKRSRRQARHGILAGSYLVSRRAYAPFALLMVASACGQDAVNLPWWTSPVVQDLGLDQAQTQRIHQIVHSYRSRLLDARNEVAKAEADFDDVLNDPQVSPAMAKPVIDRLAYSRANVTRIFTTMSVELRAVLTAEQWRQLEKRWGEVQQTKKGNRTRIQP